MHSFAVRKAIVDALCACFWYHKGLRKFMLDCGVPERYYDAQAQSGVNKRIYLRAVIDELDGRGAEGSNVIDRIGIEMSSLRGAVDKDKLDPQEASEALDHLRLMIGQAGISADKVRAKITEVKPKLSAAEKVQKLEDI